MTAEQMSARARAYDYAAAHLRVLVSNSDVDYYELKEWESVAAKLDGDAKAWRGRAAAAVKGARVNDRKP